MTDEVRKLRNEYMKEWRSKNKDKVKAAQERYWRRKSNLKNANKEEYLINEKSE